MPSPRKGEKYRIVAEEVYDSKWGRQYNARYFGNKYITEVGDYSGQRKFLSHVFTDQQVYNMYQALENPFETFLKNDPVELVKVRGCGMVTANKWLNKFNNEYVYAKMYIELEDFELTDNMIKKIFNYYGNVNVAIEKVKENPYNLCNIAGIGWKKADTIALSGGMAPNDPKRVEAYILYYLERQAMDGYSYISPDELMGAILENVDENVSDYVVTTAMHSLKDKGKLWWNEDKTKVGLAFYYELEKDIATELLRLRDAESSFEYGDWKSIIQKKEKEQGWEYTEQQLEGIKMVIENNVVCITGYGGTGKSSIVDGLLAVLHNYSSATCALAGRAASRISEMTGGESFTIHRLLGYPEWVDGKDGFSYHDENQLEYDIVIVDEISMIGGRLFYHLLRAIKSGAKLILLGDIGQLESIGECKVAADIISSPEIPSIFLDKIHRQAQKSAIVTESIRIRKGGQIIEKDFAGEEVRGELQDLLIDCYSDLSNTYFKTLQHFTEELQEVKSIMDIQILCPVKEKGSACVWNLNAAIQKIYNPYSSKKKEIEVYYGRGKKAVLREGDKVINRKNNYKTLNNEGKVTPIYNGNIGIIEKIDEGCAVVDFFEIGKIAIQSDDLENLQLGYAITVHSSQGSQFERVIFALDFAAYMMLSRELVYTGITRATKHCTLVAQNSALCYAITQEGVKSKNTHLEVILDELAHPKLVW